MREINVHDFYRRVVAGGEPGLTGLRAAAAVVSGDTSRASFGDWGAWQKPAGDTSRASFGDWSSWQKIR